MSKDEIIQMAEDCGIAHRYYEIPVSKKGVVTVESCTDRLLKFAELVTERHEWVGLTDEEIKGIIFADDTEFGLKTYSASDWAKIKRTENLLREKNVPQP